MPCPAENDVLSVFKFQHLSRRRTTDHLWMRICRQCFDSWI